MSVKGLDSLRTLFAQEAEQRLARLGQLVLELERTEIGDSADIIAEVFREVHTLKGSAAVVGFDGVGRYAHGVEEKLGQLRSGSVTPTTAIIDAPARGDRPTGLDDLGIRGRARGRRDRQRPPCSAVWMRRSR